ncbi:unnamed protein product (macronuclear) [Paramecium tetraurelia]|uniref:Transmembrane protein n=1 Tax=Paramecium tetraurelia TaxID=5888 RepID=A0D7V2_PARTE|nr:uncharacterized protein GSPATT00014086001 [Paramecium tetraurelia]CAK79119.1 unnamed protein product [Paramecium tetraurelia]|eukprot:XP_001446516.1 hypothetical protein (macronuclear) [Paramecium tetraurelia strain d4-2]
MNKPIYREYSNLKGDDGDPNNTKLVQINDDNSHTYVENSIKQTFNEYNKYQEPNIFSPSNSNCEKKELKTDTQRELKAPRLIIQNITDSDKLIEITTTDHVEKEDPVKSLKGMLGLETVEYQKKRIKFRNPTYEFKVRQKKILNWKSEAMNRWKINLIIILFVVRLEKNLNHKNQIKHQTQTTIQESENRVKKICISVLKLMFGLFLAMLISLMLLPFILISDLFLRIYTYNSLYVKYAWSYDNKCYRVILLLQLYMYALAIVIAVITNLYQSLITTVELIYNIVGTIQNNISNLSRLLFSTINTTFSKQK